MSDELYHYGTKTHSGRYPWGSGENPYQRLAEGSIRARVKELKDKGFSDKEIRETLGMSSGALRNRIALEKAEEANQIYYRVRELKEKGNSNVAIGEMLGITEGTVRNYLKADKKAKITVLRNVADELDKEMQKKKYLDVGEGANLTLGCTETRLQAAVSLLRDEKGYEYHDIYVDQLGTNNKTKMVVLCPPGTTKKYLYDHLDQIREIDESKRIDTDGSVKVGAVNPRSVDRSRILVRYAEEGGADKDGTIEIRRGVDDISLGNNHYAQVRIAVDDKRYMKGMAFYNDNMPKGYDIIYNSNKPKGSSDDAVFKDMKFNKDGTMKDNPFGATIKGLTDGSDLKLTQRYYIDKDGNKQQSCINIVNEEGTWNTWTKSLSSQFLSKQTIPLARRQLDLAYKQSYSTFDDICKLTEPSVKRNLLIEFSDKCDAAAAELKAAALPRQRSQVILPVTTLKDNEVYAPNYKNGEHVVLVRHPHGGPFEAPELIVNNNNREAKSVLGTKPSDAIGINVNVAKKLSGADFDGDSVLVLPSDNVHIKNRGNSGYKAGTLQELQDFDPNKYALPDTKVKNEKTGEMEYLHPTIKNNRKQALMGQVSNLITDMTIKGAKEDEIVRAVKHSMVVIDSEKHRLDIKQSEKDFGINELKVKYQGGTLSRPKGASTIISLAGSEKRIDEQKQWYFRESKPGDINEKTGQRRSGVDPTTGEKIYETTGRTYPKDKKIKDPITGKVIGYEPTGKVATRQTTTTKMQATGDPYTLTSDKAGIQYPMEGVYAAHAKRMKDLANTARKEALSVQDRPYSPSAAKTYANEVKSLEIKLLEAKKNAPRERQATLLANSMIKAEIAADPSLKDDKDRLKKVRGQALTSARIRVGAKKKRIDFTDKEWEAIQAGAIRKTKLNDILNNADKDVVKQRAMPKNNNYLSDANKSAIKAMLASGHTQAEIAEVLGISTTTVNNVVNGK